MKKVPSPEEVAAAVQRVQNAASITFDLDLRGWRTVFLVGGRGEYAERNPQMSVMFWRPVPVVATPYMPSIDATLVATLSCLDTHKATLLFDAGGVATVGFRPCNDQSEQWFRLQFARLMRMRFREHGLVKPDAIFYRK
jgi:hypothetical protein